MVIECRPLRRLCHRSKLQHPASDPATVFWRPVLGQLGTVLKVRAVRLGFRFSHLFPIMFFVFWVSTYWIADQTNVRTVDGEPGLQVLQLRHSSCFSPA